MKSYHFSMEWNFRSFIILLLFIDHHEMKIFSRYVDQFQSIYDDSKTNTISTADSDLQGFHLWLLYKSRFY